MSVSANPFTSAIPYQYYAADGVIVCDNGALLAAYECDGALYECATDQTLNRQRDAINQLLRTIASPDLSLWIHAIHRKITRTPPGNHAAHVAAAVVADYQQHLSQQPLFDVRWFVSILQATAATVPVAPSLKARLAKNAAELAWVIPPSRDRLNQLEQLCSQIETGLKPYRPRRLGQCADGMHCDLMQFLSELINGHATPRLRPYGIIAAALPLNDIHTGWEIIEHRSGNKQQLSAILGIKEYPHFTYPGMLDRLLSAPFEWTLTHSFTLLPKAQAVGLLSRQQQRLKNTNDPALSQQQAVDQAMDALVSNDFVMGDHHCSLRVTASAQERATADVSAAAKELAQHISIARHLCANAGIMLARENISMEAAFWAQLPGNHRLRARKVPITSRNLASLVSLHNLAKGQAHGNPWGDSLLPLKTAAGTVFEFSLHPPQAALDRPDHTREAAQSVSLNAAHTFICGPTGSGKTVLAALLISTLVNRQITQVVFDKDQGLQRLVDSLGGRYEIFKSDGQVRLNPLSLPDTAQNRQFLVRWLKLLLRSTLRALPTEIELETAVSGVMALPLAQRRLSRLREFFDPTHSHSPYEHLARWCLDTAGVYGQIFDGGQDDWQALFAAGGLLGIDMTEAFKNAELREPLCAYLFHLIDCELKGPPCVVWIDEFARFLKDTAFQEFVDDACRTWRKRNGVMALLTQSPSDTAQSPIARTLIEQMPTRIFLPNANASAEDYCDHYGLSEREFELISKVLPTRAHQFLIKQPPNDVVVELDLTHCTTVLDIIGNPRRSFKP